MTSNNHRITGLVAATFCPFNNDGRINYDLIINYVDHLLENGVIGVFVNGSCGEGPSLSVDERKGLAEAWIKHGKGKFQEIIIHCGSSSLPEAKVLAAHAAEIGATGVACVPPFYYKTTQLDGVVAFLAEVASCCRDLPFYYYHFPGITAVNFSATAVFEAAGLKIPNLAGMKFTSADIKDAWAVANMADQSYQCLVGFDDLYLSGLANGLGSGAIGAFHNVMARVFVRVKEAFERGDLPAARKEQGRIDRIIAINTKYTTGLVCREFLDFVGLEMGPPRAPLTAMTDENKRAMKKELEEMGFFDWIN